VSHKDLKVRFLYRIVSSLKILRMRALRVCLGLVMLLNVRCHDEVEEISIETVKQEDDVAYITPDHHPDVFFSDHFDHQVEKCFQLFYLLIIPIYCCSFKQFSGSIFIF